jgi:ATP-dependent Lon protease
MNDPLEGEDLLSEIKKLEDKINSVSLPLDLSEKLLSTTNRLKLTLKLGEYIKNFDSVSRLIDWCCGLPWQKRSEDILDLNKARKVLDENHYGLVQVKERILEYLSVLILQKQRLKDTKIRAPILCLVGLVGTGKTTLTYSIAQALGRKFFRIPFGGLGDPSFLRGKSSSLDDSEPGQIIKAIKYCGTKNPVILLDEIDRVAEESRSTIMGVLIELLDPQQNERFNDYYLDYPFDLSEVLFVATANNTTNISTAVLDRLEPMNMPSYNDEEKTTIGKKYILPRTMKSMGLTDNDLEISEDVWLKIIRPLGFDAGVRTLERNISSICRRVAKQIVGGHGGRIVINENNLKEFIQS